MFDSISPSEAATAAGRTDGAADLAFAAASPGQTRLSGLYQRAPLRALFPTGGEGGLAHAVLLTTTGGMVGGDRLRVGLTTGPGAAAQVTTQAAEKVYRSLGADCRIDVRLRADGGSWLEWLPQETILFEGARLDRRTYIDCAAGARVLAGEMLVFGRRAHGETLTRGRIREAFEVRRDGRLVWADALAAAGDLAAVLTAPACLAGAAAVATIVYLGEAADDALRFARDLTEGGAPGEMATATSVAGVLIVRWLAGDARALRDAFGRVWVAFRQRLGGWAPLLPRVWCV